MNGDCRGTPVRCGSRPPGVPIAIEGQDLAAVPPGKVFIYGIGLNTPDGGILDVGVFLFQQQEMQAQGGKEGCEAVFPGVAAAFVPPSNPGGVPSTPRPDPGRCPVCPPRPRPGAGPAPILFESPENKPGRRRGLARRLKNPPNRLPWS